MEAANIVVQRVETENDIGRDAFVDIVDGTDVTGGVVCIQVKSGRSSHFFKEKWLLPGDPADFTLWRESTVPFFGVVHDEMTDALRWVDLSEAAALDVDKFLSPKMKGPFGRQCVPVPEGNRLDLDIAPFLTAAHAALRQRTAMPVAALIDDDIERVCSGIIDTFAVGRHDATAFLLLAALFHRLPKGSRQLAIDALAMTTSHPDVLWTQSNWVPQVVKDVIRSRIRWTGPDIAAMLDEIDDENGMGRGSIGQSVFNVLTLDQALKPKLFDLTLNRSLSDKVRFWAGAMLLYLADDATDVLIKLMRSDKTRHSSEGLFALSRGLEDVEGFDYLIASVDEHGYVSLF